MNPGIVRAVAWLVVVVSAMVALQTIVGFLPAASFLRSRCRNRAERPG